jgi:hypothetical protein
MGLGIKTIGLYSDVLNEERSTDNSRRSVVL